MTVEELASHCHPYIYNGPGDQAGSPAIPYSSVTNPKLENNQRTIGYTGGNNPHSNLQPVSACYMFKRTK